MSASKALKCCTASSSRCFCRSESISRLISAFSLSTCSARALMLSSARRFRALSSLSSSFFEKKTAKIALNSSLKNPNASSFRGRLVSNGNTSKNLPGQETETTFSLNTHNALYLLPGSDVLLPPLLALSRRADCCVTGVPLKLFASALPARILVHPLFLHQFEIVVAHLSKSVRGQVRGVQCWAVRAHDRIRRRQDQDFAAFALSNRTVRFGFKRARLEFTARRPQAPGSELLAD